MTTYIVITDPETDPDAPLTSELAKKWRDNAIAMAEGDPTAPVNQGNWHPYNKVTNGDANTGAFYSGTTVASVVTPDFVDGYDYMVTWSGLSHNSGSVQSLQVEYYREVGAVYNPVATIGSLGAANNVAEGFLELTDVRRVKNHLFNPYSSMSQSTATSLGNSSDSTLSLSYLRNVFVTPQKVLRVRFSPTGGSFDGGNMYLYRRRLIT
jgi:hypothetical protein